MTLKASIAEHALFARLRAAEHSRLPPADITFARQSDFAVEDVATLRVATHRYRLLVVFRCPKIDALAFQGIFDPKRLMDSSDKVGNPVKSGLLGLGVHPDSSKLFVSDYDMMSLWVRRGGDSYERLFASSLDPMKPRGSWDREAMNMVRLLNKALVSKVQHGAQDNYSPPPGKKHPGVESHTRFAAFREGKATFLPTMASCKAFYKEWSLHWPYDVAGNFTGVEQR